MDTCAVETGLLSKKPCGQPAATHCANCEMALCSKHAVPQFSNGNKTGKFMCKECDAAKKAIDKTDAQKKKQAAAAPPAPPAAKPAPAAAPAAKAGAPATKPGAPAPKPADDDAPLEFTPSKPKPPTEKK
jgi:hypothetical protein